MSVKRWKGAASGAWATLNSGSNYNWLAGDGSNATEIPRSAWASPLQIDTAATNGLAITFTTASPHGLVSGDSVRFAGFAGGTWNYLNWANPNPPTNGTGITLSVTRIDDYTFTTDFAIVYGAHSDVGTVRFMGDDVQMLSGDKGANYCTTGPASSTTVNSLTVTIAADVSAPGILASNGANLSIASGCTITDAAAVTGAVTSGNVILGSGSSRPVLPAGSVSTFRLQPPNTTNTGLGGRTVAVDISSGAAVSLISLVHFDLATPKIGGSVGMTTGSQIAGILNLGNPSDYTDGGTGCAFVGVPTFLAGYTLNLCHTTAIALAAPATLGTAGGTVNVNAPVAFALSAGSLSSMAGFNVNAATVLYSTSSLDAVTGNVTITARSPLTLANFGVAMGYALSVNSLGYPVEVCDVTGTVNVTGARVSTAGVGKSPLISTGA